MKYHFDNRGNLFPYDIIRIESLSEFEQTFVTVFPLSATRFPIYSGLLEYIQTLGDVLAETAYMGTWRLWVNGSFTTNKLNPNDVDVLSLLDDEAALHQHKDRFEPLFGQNAFRVYQTDAYFVLDDGTEQARELTAYWTNQFGVDRSGAKKGIIELLIDLN